MSRYKKQTQNYSGRNKLDNEWMGNTNYYPRNNYYINNYYNNYYNYGNYNDNYYNYYNNYYDYNKRNYHNNNYYNNYYYYNYKRGGRHPYKYYYREVELEQTNEMDEKFKEDLKKIGYYIREVKGDGNCLFRSVAEQMEENENKYQEYREKCVEYMIEKKEEFVPFLEEDQTLDEYIEKISKDGEWGGNLEIYALSMALKVNFHIYIYEQPIYVVKNWEDPKMTIMLTYHNGKHYNSLRKLEEIFIEDKDNERKENKEDKNEDIKDNNNENEKNIDNEKKSQKNENEKEEKKMNDVSEVKKQSQTFKYINL